MSQKQNDQIYFQMYKLGFERKSGRGGWGFILDKKRKGCLRLFLKLVDSSGLGLVQGLLWG